MRISDLLSMCFRSLFRRKVRTILTVAGVVIGTCSIVVMISLGVGLNEIQKASIEEMMDLTVIEVYPTGEMSMYGGSGGGGEKTVKLNDKMLDLFAEQAEVLAVTPVLDLYSEAKITNGKYQYGGSMKGVDMEALPLFGYEIKEGKAISGADRGSKVLMGESAVYNFYYMDANGEYIYIYPDENGDYPEPFFDPMKARLTITPINNAEMDMGNAMPSQPVPDDMESEGESGQGGGISAASGKSRTFQVSGILKGDYSKDYGETFYGLYIDIDTAKQLLKEHNALNGIASSSITYPYAKVKVKEIGDVEAVEAFIQEQGFQTFSAASIRESLQQMMNMIQMALGGIGAISLLVAALGITNTMIMSIYERTREIGVMKVLGCRLKDIRMLFMMEAGAIGFFGGVFGIMLSYMISLTINLIAGAIMQSQGAEAATSVSVIPFWLVLLGCGIALLVALAAGSYPARRAMRISALAAIRQE